jgi:SAM-dependent methyltransferase
LGLAQLGYTLTASDLSPKEIDRAKREAQARDLVIDFSVADMRHAFDHHQKQADVLISVDNAVPHLLHDEEILQAFRQFYQCVRVGGGCLITVRDYEKEDLSGIQYKPHGVRYLDGMKTVIWQVWEFDNDIYDVTMYFVHDEGSSEGMVQIFRGKYYAIGVTKLMALMREAGFGNVRRLDGVFYQPVIVGTKLGARVE